MQGSLVNNNPGSKIFTMQQIAAFCAADPLHFISYWCYRNPTSVYNYIIMNYPAFGRLANGMAATTDGINNMYDYLAIQYNALPAAQQKQWLYNLGYIMPAAIEARVVNWTTPM